ELELINTDGTTFRIDRLRIDGSRCTLFDYKTGMITVGHYAQLSRYEAILSTMGFEVIGKYLISIDNRFTVDFHDASEL
ncbi:MAG: hypothetical protein LBQ64_03490, partial [Bacteroidales bacterium]|nr:hypothetical protein [Bacteroidales bacterium]